MHHATAHWFITLISLILLASIASCKPVESESVHENQNILFDPKTVDAERATRLASHCESAVTAFEKLEQQEGWLPWVGNFWSNNNGDIGFATYEATDICISPYFLKTMGINEVEQPFNKVLDKKTFKQVGSFYKDKHHVYYHFPMSGGGFIAILAEADVASFKAINESCFGKDKRHIFTEKGEFVKADYASFKAMGCFGKDKKGYFFWEDRQDAEQVKAMDEAIKAVLDR
jgi:hypothetical protein